MKTLGTSFLTALAWLLALPGTAAVASAGWPGAAAQTSDSLHAEHQLGQVEVRANSRKMLSSTAPLQLLRQEEMLRLGVTDMADALHRMPGINLRDYGGAGGMKTVSLRGLGAQHTGVSYDGILLSESQGGEIDLSRYSLDHVKALRLTIGDNEDIFQPARQASVAALLAIETLGDVPADHLPHLTTQLRLGSFGYTSPYVRYVQRLGDRLTLSALGEYVYAENDYPFILYNGTATSHERRTNSRMNSGHAELNLHYRLAARQQLWTKVYYYDNDRQLPGIVRYYTNLSVERLRDRHLFGQMRWQGRSPNEQWMWKVNAKASWSSSAYRDSLVAGRRNDATYWQREYYASGALMWMPSEHWAVDYSADWMLQNLNSTLPTDQHPHRHGILQSVTAKYSAHRLTVLARLLGSIYLNGVKLGEAARDMRRFSPSVSASYRVLDGRSDQNSGVYDELYLRASYKDIFRVPTFNESYFFHYGSTDLRAEKARQLNVGVTWHHASPAVWEMQMTVDGYLNRVKDKIVGVPYNMFIWRTENLGRVDVKGLDASLRAEWNLVPARQLASGRTVPGHRLSLMGGYSYQQVLNHSDSASPHYGKQVAYTPRHAGSVALGWENPWVCVSLHGQGMSSRWANNNHYEGTEVSGFWDWGLTLYRSLGRWTLRGDVKNLLAKQYEIIGHYPMPRRSWEMSVNYSF